MQKQSPYPFELVIRRTGLFVMSSKTFDELSLYHKEKTGHDLKDYLQIKEFKISRNGSGSYTIRGQKVLSGVPVEKVSAPYGKKINYHGIELTLAEILRMKGFSVNQSVTIRQRIERGWPVMDALDTPIGERKPKTVAESV